MAKGARHGYTTGACAAAAAKEAALLLQGQALIDSVTIVLPRRVRHLTLHGQTFIPGRQAVGDQRCRRRPVSQRLRSLGASAASLVSMLLSLAVSASAG
jgi:hypothetical protein